MTNTSASKPRRRIVGIAVLITGIAMYARDPFPLAFHAERWWAFFLLIPALGLLFGRRGEAGSQGRVGAAGGMIGVAAVFLLTPGFGLGWPLLLIAVGLAAVV